MGKAKEVHWHGLRSFRVVIRRVPESSPHNLLPLDTQRHTPPSCRDVSPSPKTLRSVAYGSSLHSLLSHLSMRKIKRALASLPLRVEVCVCAIIESHRNRITHGYRDGRETMVVSFANRCQGGFLCSFLVSFSGNCN